MMKPWLKNTLFILMWVVVAIYIIFASLSVRSHRSALTVNGVNIKIIDSSAVANLVTRSMVERWVSESRVRTVNQAVDSLNLSALENYILANGFVDQVKCYTSYSGELHIEISQLCPVLRILLDGYNSYVTAEGHHFARPPASSRYTPIITGGYTPFFRPGYSGDIHEVYDAQKEDILAEIKRMEKENIHPLYKRRVEIREQLRVVNSRYMNRRLFQSRKKFDIEVEKLRDSNSRERNQLQRAAYENEQAIEREQRKQKVYEDKQKKLEKKYQDFINLITFVNVVENDKFWSSEIVQIVASESTNGGLRLELIPRSGDHTIIFGQPYDIKERLDNAKMFYREVLSKEGWDKFKSINVEYKNQVVCK